jgi:cell division protein FtsN
MRKTLMAAALAVVIGVAGCSREQSDWEKAHTANNADSYEVFVKKYPNGSFTAQAQARLKEIYEERDWQKARDADTPEAYQAFLKQYPEGKWTEEARIRLENFTLAQTPSGTPLPTDGTAGSPLPPGTETPSAGGTTVKPLTAPTAAPAAKSASKAAAAAAIAGTGAVAAAHTPAAKSASADKHAVKASSGAAAKSAVAAGAGPYVIQLGAFKAGADAANRHWAHLEKEFPTALEGLSPTVKPTDSAATPLYRLQVAGLTRAAAHSVCATLKARKSACIVLPKSHS